MSGPGPRTPADFVKDIYRRLRALESRQTESAWAVGDYKAIAHSTPGEKWLLCDGQAVSRTTYQVLFETIGTTYGVGNGSTTFQVPNLKGRVLVMRDPAQTEFDTLGETGGAKTHTLTVTEMPAHTHSTPANAGIPSGTGAFARSEAGGSTTTGSTGGGGAHNNLQPYLVGNVVIRALP